jgi:type IV secretory pathway TrbD component
MSTEHPIPELDASGLRRFALTTGAIVAVLFGLLLPWFLGLGFPLIPWIIAAALVLWGAIAPSTLRPVYVGWMRFGLVMNRITTPLVLGAIFYVVFTPVGLVMKLFGRDAMLCKLDPHAPSYRVKSRKSPPEKMERPF